MCHGNQLERERVNFAVFPTQDILTVQNGKISFQGGDSVRLWLVSPALGASTAADVIDNKDGSFLAISLLPWSGEVKVRATIAHSRELFRAALFIQVSKA